MSDILAESDLREAADDSSVENETALAFSLDDQNQATVS